jgi:hypothetical protein
MQRICNFLEVPFEAQMTSLEGADRSAIGSGRHHEMVRSNFILGLRTRAEPLSPALRAKIARYVCRWKQRYDGRWPKYPLELPEGTTPPSFLELWRDRIVYRCVLCRDKTVALIYAVAPIGIAHWLRRQFRRRSYKRGLLPASQ